MLPLNLITLTLSILLSSIDAHVFIYGGCSQDKYPPNSPYESSKISLLSSLASSSSRTLYDAISIANDTDSASYGLYQCRGDLSPRDCASCIAGAINQVAVLCPDTYGASLQLDACYLRYERADFLGRLDTGLRYRKCGVGGNVDGEFWRRRDDVLAELEGAAGFRVSATGAVEGYAQCLGDMAAGDCSECLAEAVAKVKMLCGAAPAADVYLAQCYVRYWESGYYTTSSSSSDSSNGDDVGKTVAIIVGVVAGVAVLIVFLSFCRKALG
ncbi:plasmodesmata-located protein 8 [Salvia hispanica]|uniref:plasmodesmata-located protein 8 n=1 Tax=Salvia hispanica TaxID=49212 RepID=UPI0020099993|nr:plasmodesmata-located protein 8 [Salvia hispanica]